MLTTADRSPTTGSTPYANAFMLTLPQVLIWPFAVFWLTFEGMASAGCGPAPEGNGACDAAADAANVGLWIALPVLAVLTFVALVVWQERGWRTWPVVLGGVGLTIIATFVATQVLLRAFQVI